MPLYVGLWDLFIPWALTQGAGASVLGEIGHPRLCKFGGALMPHLGFKSKNNVKFCKSASYKSPRCIYTFIVPTLDILKPGLSDETVEIVSDLFLLSHSSLISRLLVSGILLWIYCSMY